jgi:uncharacterized phiE125 gp8 family phage protein
MKITKVNKPVGLAYPLNKVKEHLRNQGYNEEDLLLSTYISAAVDFIEGYSWTSLQSTSYIGYADTFEDFEIDMYPVTEITSVKYYDVNGTLQTMTNNVDYYSDLKGSYAKIKFENTFTLRDQPFNNIEVAFKAGYLSHFEIPDDFIAALFILVADLTESRQSFSQGMAIHEIDIPMAVKSILDNNSKRRFV